MSLTFEQLREANVKRCEQSFFPINTWSLTDWGCALAGEVGEACNKVKKLKRAEDQRQSRMTVKQKDDMRHEIGKELADAITYIDLMAARLGLKLDVLVQHKFNEVSDRVGSTIKL